MIRSIFIFVPDEDKLVNLESLLIAHVMALFLYLAARTGHLAFFSSVFLLALFLVLSVVRNLDWLLLVPVPSLLSFFLDVLITVSSDWYSYISSQTQDCHPQVISHLSVTPHGTKECHLVHTK